MFVFVHYLGGFYRVMIRVLCFSLGGYVAFVVGDVNHGCIIIVFVFFLFLGVSGWGYCFYFFVVVIFCFVSLLLLSLVTHVVVPPMLLFNLRGISRVCASIVCLRHFR